MCVVELSLSGHVETMQQVQHQLDALSADASFLPSLFDIIALDTISLDIRVAAAIFLKNMLKKFWLDLTASQNDPIWRETVRSRLLEIVIHCPYSHIVLQCAEGLRIVGRTDFIGGVWPELPTTLQMACQACVGPQHLPQPGPWERCLIACNAIAKSLQYADYDDGGNEPLCAELFLQSLLPVFLQFIQAISTCERTSLSIHANGIVLVQKAIFRCCYSSRAPLLSAEALEAFLRLGASQLQRLKEAVCLFGEHALQCPEEHDTVETCPLLAAQLSQVVGLQPPALPPLLKSVKRHAMFLKQLSKLQAESLHSHFLHGAFQELLAFSVQLVQAPLPVLLPLSYHPSLLRTLQALLEVIDAVLLSNSLGDRLIHGNVISTLGKDLIVPALRLHRQECEQWNADPEEFIRLNFPSESLFFDTEVTGIRPSVLLIAEHLRDVLQGRQAQVAHKPPKKKQGARGRRKGARAQDPSPAIIAEDLARWEELRRNCEDCLVDLLTTVMMGQEQEKDSPAASFQLFGIMLLCASWWPELEFREKMLDCGVIPALQMCHAVCQGTHPAANYAGPIMAAAAYLVAQVGDDLDSEVAQTIMAALIPCLKAVRPIPAEVDLSCWPVWCAMLPCHACASMALRTLLNHEEAEAIIHAVDLNSLLQAVIASARIHGGTFGMPLLADIVVTADSAVVPLAVDLVTSLSHVIHEEVAKEQEQGRCYASEVGPAFEALQALVTITENESSFWTQTTRLQVRQHALAALYAVIGVRNASTEDWRLLSVEGIQMPTLQDHTLYDAAIPQLLQAICPSVEKVSGTFWCTIWGFLIHCASCWSLEDMEYCMSCLEIVAECCSDHAAFYEPQIWNPLMQTVKDVMADGLAKEAAAACGCAFFALRRYRIDVGGAKPSIDWCRPLIEVTWHRLQGKGGARVTRTLRPKLLLTLGILGNLDSAALRSILSSADAAAFGLLCAEYMVTCPVLYVQAWMLRTQIAVCRLSGVPFLSSPQDTLFEYPMRRAAQNWQSTIMRALFTAAQNTLSLLREEEEELAFTAAFGNLLQETRNDPVRPSPHDSADDDDDADEDDSELEEEEEDEDKKEEENAEDEINDEEEAESEEDFYRRMVEMSKAFARGEDPLEYDSDNDSENDESHAPTNTLLSFVLPVQEASEGQGALQEFFLFALPWIQDSTVIPNDVRSTEAFITVMQWMQTRVHQQLSV